MADKNTITQQAEAKIKAGILALEHIGVSETEIRRMVERLLNEGYRG